MFLVINYVQVEQTVNTVTLINHYLYANYRVVPLGFDWVVLLKDNTMICGFPH